MPNALFFTFNIYPLSRIYYYLSSFRYPLSIVLKLLILFFYSIIFYLLHSFYSLYTFSKYTQYYLNAHIPFFYLITVYNIEFDTLFYPVSFVLYPSSSIIYPLPTFLYPLFYPLSGIIYRLYFII